MNPPRRILVVATRRIGDVLLTTPLIRSLRQAWPEAKIDALVFAGTEGVLVSNPDINEVITVAPRLNFFPHLRFLRRLWRRYDLALSMMPGDRPTLYARIAGKRCIGLVAAGSKHRWKKLILSKCILFDNINTHTVLMNLQVADLLGVPHCHEVVAAWNAQDETIVRKTLPFDPDVEAFAVLHVYPMYAYKAWRREAWIELADWLSKHFYPYTMTMWQALYMGKRKGNEMLISKRFINSICFLSSSDPSFFGFNSLL